MENDPLNTPVEGGPAEGQLENTEAPASPEPTVDPVTQEIEGLKQQNAEFQKRMTEQGRTIAKLKNQPPEQTAPAMQPASPEEWFNDPDGNTQRAIDSALKASEQRQDNKEQARRELHRRAQDRGMTVDQMEQIYGGIVDASKDPDAMMDLIERVHQAQNTSAQIQGAAQAIGDSVNRDARAVVAQTGASATPDTGPLTEEQFRGLTTEQQEEYIKRNIGVGDWEDL